MKRHAPPSSPRSRARRSSRTNGWLALPVPSLAVLCAAACSSAQSTSDGGVDHKGLDGAVVVEASTDGSEADAARADASDAADGATADAGAPVSITVSSAAGPEPNVLIVNDDASGAYVATYSTGPSGTFWGPLPASSMVTILLGTVAHPALHTIVGVQPGDAITLVDSGDVPAENFILTSIPQPPPSGTTQYLLTAGFCTDGFVGTPSPYYVGSDCVSVEENGGVFAYGAPLLVRAMDDAQHVVGSIGQKDFQLATLDDGGSANVALTGAWQTPVAEALQILNGPSVPSGVSIADVVQGTLVPTRAQPPDPADGGLENVYYVDQGFADSMQGQAVWESSEGFAAVGVASNAPFPASSPGSLDLDATAVATFPQIGGGQAVAGTDGLPRITWSTGALDAVTAIAGFAEWLSQDSQVAGTWTVVAPPTTDMFLQAPALGPQASWGPGSGATFPGVTIFAAQGTALPTYQTARQSPSFFVDPGPCGLGSPGLPASAIAPALPPGTSLVVSGYTQPPPVGCGP